MVIDLSRVAPDLSQSPPTVRVDLNAHAIAVPLTYHNHAPNGAVNLLPILTNGTELLCGPVTLRGVLAFIRTGPGMP